MNRCVDSSQFKRKPVQDCVQCPWFVSGEEAVLIYTANVVVAGSGTISSSPGSTGNVAIQFFFQNTLIKTINVLIGEYLAFTLAGFNRIFIVELDGKQATGQFCLTPHFHAD